MIAEKVETIPIVRTQFSTSKLFWAAREGNVADVQALLVGAQSASSQHVNETNADGYTALMMAAAHGHLEVCLLLLEHGADPLLKDNYGRTALDKAIRYNHPKVQELLQPLMKR